jgi:hypothetical protein
MSRTKLDIFKSNHIKIDEKSGPIYNGFQGGIMYHTNAKSNFDVFVGGGAS